MAYAVLDIGAGSCVFAKELRSLNRRVPMLVLCGEPRWLDLPFFRALSPEKACSMLQNGSKGVKHLNASYEKFGLPAASLDMVTLNCPHPFSIGAVGKMGSELERCLKPGGIFFSSFPAFDLARVPEHFVHLADGGWMHGKHVRLDTYLLPKGAPSLIPQSPVLRSNIRTHRFGNPQAGGSGYLYHDGIRPGWKLWQKPL